MTNDKIDALIEAGDKIHDKQWYSYAVDDFIGPRLHFGYDTGGVQLHKDTPDGNGIVKFCALAANSREEIKAMREKCAYYDRIAEILEDVVDDRPQKDGVFGFRGTTKGKVLKLIKENKALKQRERQFADANELADYIRTINGNGQMSAGELAERILGHLNLYHKSIYEANALKQRQAVDVGTLKHDRYRVYDTKYSKKGKVTWGDGWEDAIDNIAAQGMLNGGCSYFDSLVNKAKQSAEKASKKFPQPNYVALKIAEEAGEVVRGCVHYAEGRMEWSEVEGEIVQLMAMLHRLVYEGDEVNGVIPPKQPKESEGAE